MKKKRIYIQPQIHVVKVDIECGFMNNISLSDFKEEETDEEYGI